MSAHRAAPRTALPAIALTLTVLAAGACGQDDPPRRPAGSTPSPSQPQPPSYSPDQLKASLLSAKEVGKGIQELPEVAVEALQKQQAPMCSLSGSKLPGDPEITVRQYSNPAQGADEIKYAQLVAWYDNADAAATSFQALKAKAKACPTARRIPARKVRKNVTTLAHDDTWKIVEDNVAGWTHLRGIEHQTYSAAATKSNVLQLMYDYAVRGNIVIATVYWERAEPKRSSVPVERRATDLLTKQLQKIG